MKHRLTALLSAAALLATGVAANASSTPASPRLPDPQPTIHTFRGDPASEHSLTRRVESGIQSASSEPDPASEHSLTRLVESGTQTPSVQSAAAYREAHATGSKPVGRPRRLCPAWAWTLDLIGATGN